MRAALNVPTRTGGNASGTWSINVNGNAAAATSATSATNATYAQSAGSATNATYANSAGSVANATYATTAGSTGVLTGYQFYNSQLGYTRIGSQGSNKFLLNWGKSGYIRTNQDAYQTFRTAFAHIYCVVATREESQSAASYAWSAGQASNSGFRLYSNGARNGNYYWIAVGR